MKTKQLEVIIDVEHIYSFKEYHQQLFDDFIYYKNYTKLEEYLMLFDLIEEFRMIRNPRIYFILENYITDIKDNAKNFIDLADRYGYYDNFRLVDDYCDRVWLL